MTKTSYLIGTLGIAFLVSSCVRSVSYDIKGERDVKFFTNNVSSGNAPENSITYRVTNIPDASGTGLVNLSSNLPDSIRFPVFATKPVGQDVVIGAELNNDLIAAYNAAHNTNYVAFPDGLLDTDNLAARISQGSTASEEPFAIPTDVSSLDALTETSYMAPIELTTVSDPGAGEITASPVSQVTFITADVELRLIKYNAGPADALGSLLTPQASWTTIFTPDPVNTGDIFDGSNSTYTRWGSSPGQVDVNMQTTYNVTGLRLYTNSSSFRIPTQAELYLSDDGINYKLIGSLERADMAFTSSYNYILFYKAIPAQYIRLVLHYSTSGSSQNRRLAELSVYAN